MFWHSVLAVLAWSSLVLSLLIFLYHAFLAIVAMIPRRKIPAGELEACEHRFSIVIPAHNEEYTIRVALDSCEKLNYPSEKVDVYVIADNCDDSTATVAKGYEVHVLTRDDTENRGKGYALSFAFEQVLRSPCDAVVVLDADCRIHSETLRVADYHLRSGERVLQCQYRVGNIEESSTTLLLAMANALENDFFYAPKSRLGLFVLLRGTGMVFHREILERYPWNASSVIEDAQYAYRLVLEGVKARFVPEVDVISDFPSSRPQLTVQRERWFGGGVSFAVTLSPKMLAIGLKRCKLTIIDAAISTWIIMRPFVVAQLGLTILLTLTVWSLPESGAAALSPLAAAGLICIGYATYAAIGFMTLGGNVTRLRLLLCLPLVFATYLWLSARTLVRGAPTDWRRTPRESGITQ